MNRKNKNKEQYNILLVDDNEGVRNAFAFFLKNLRNFIFEIEKAASGEAAVEMVKEDNFGFIFMDYSMPPGMSGPEAIKLIKKIKPGIKILGISSYTEAGVVEQMMNAGADGYLIKNFGKHEIPEAIKTVQAGGFYYSPEIKKLLDV